MQTSYFAKSATDPNAVAITIKKPPFFKGRHYPKLAPPSLLLLKYKNDHDENFYQMVYIRDVLNKLKPMDVVNELGEDAVLICWEGKDKFCHRHIVAEWLKSNGVYIEEKN